MVLNSVAIVANKMGQAVCTVRIYHSSQQGEIFVAKETEKILCNLSSALIVIVRSCLAVW